MSILKNFFGVDNFFKDETVISLSALRKRSEYVRVTIPEGYKKTFIPNLEQNYLLF